MPLAFAPHMVTIRPKSAGLTAAMVRESISHEDPGPIMLRCQVTQESPARAFERFGIEMTEPWLLLAPAPRSADDPASFLVEGNRVDWSWRGVDRSFVIEKVQMVDVGQPADNVAVIMRARTPRDGPDA